MSDQERETARSAATRWYARLTSDDISEQERSNFEEWLEESGTNRQAYADMQSMLGEVDEARDLVLSFEASSPRSRLRGLDMASPRVWLAAAAVVLALGGAWLLQNAGRDQRFQTQTAERRSVELADGSVVLLNAESGISVALSDSTRRVRLEVGEALFDVVSEDARPFEVRTGGGVIRVVGTRFNARTDSAGTTVTVVEGVVAVAASGTDRPDEEIEFRELLAGQQLHYNPGEPGEVTAVDPEWVTAWREGRLVYQGETLAQVLRDLSRYLPARDLRAERGLADLRVSGTFRLDDIDGSLEALEVALPIRQIRLGSEILFVRELKD